MQNTFTPQAVEIVKQAIDHDNLGEYEKALTLYRRSLEFFMTGLKYEQNPAARKMILERVDGYMKRAEEIKNVLESQSGPPPSKEGGGGAKTLNKNDPKNKDNKEDDEQAKMRGTLSSAIVSEKPNVKWDDVAGLEGAKEALKEGSGIISYCYQHLIRWLLTVQLKIQLLSCPPSFHNCLLESGNPGKVRFIYDFSVYCPIRLVGGS